MRTEQALCSRRFTQRPLSSKKAELIAAEEAQRKEAEEAAAAEKRAAEEKAAAEAKAAEEAKAAAELARREKMLAEVGALQTGFALLHARFELLELE